MGLFWISKGAILDFFLSKVSKKSLLESKSHQKGYFGGGSFGFTEHDSPNSIHFCQNSYYHNRNFLLYEIINESPNLILLLKKKMPEKSTIAAIAFPPLSDP